MALDRVLGVEPIFGRHAERHSERDAGAEFRNLGGTNRDYATSRTVKRMCLMPLVYIKYNARHLTCD